MHKPRLAIIGLGQYYRKLEPSIGEFFTPVLKADAEEATSGGKLKALVAPSAPDAIMLLTPNRVHAEQVYELAELRIPTFVEKPAATTEVGLSLLLQSIQKNPSLYCSDFYLDVRAAPLLAWMRRPYPKSLEKWFKIERDDGGFWQQG